MLSEEFFSAVCGPPLAPNTAISKDIGIYGQTFTPSYTIKSNFKKSSCMRHGLAITDTHVFAAQDGKAHVHVYNRARGNQEALVSFVERIQCLALAGNVLMLGTIEGRLILWETCTGRQVTTPPCHVQGVSCISVTSTHVLSGSDDSNINVWSLSGLLDFDSQGEPEEPVLVLSNHRGGITDLASGSGCDSETSICVSASTDKTCIIWNYQTGQVLRTLLFPTVPLCMALNPSAQAIYTSTAGGAFYVTELYGDRPVLGSQAPEAASIVVQVGEPVGTADEELGDALCLTPTNDGTIVLTGHSKGKILRWSLTEHGHPAELANLNAAVSNIVFSPLLSTQRPVRAVTIVKPQQQQSQYSFSAQLDRDLTEDSRFSKMLNAQGFPLEDLEKAIEAVSSPVTDGEDSLLWKIAESQRTLHKDRALQHGPL